MSRSRDKALALAKQVILQDTPYSLYAICPTDFLAFFVSTVVRNGNFADFKLFLRDLGGNFRFKSKPVLFDFYSL